MSGQFVLVVSAALLAVGAIGMLVRAKMQKKTVFVWLFSAILVADLIGAVLVLVGANMR